MPIITLRNVHKSFGNNPVLKNVSFSVNQGQVVALIGASGSGKSTALRCIDRLETINGGSIEVCGHKVEDPHLNLRKLRQDVGIVFQSYNLFPHLTIEQNITLGPVSVQKMAKAEAKRLALSVLNQVGLADKADSYPEQLSGGQQQRAAIARSLAMKPKVMLFDEVTSALDPKLTGEVLRVIERLAGSGMTMIMVTHEMNFARDVSSETIFMHNGLIEERGHPKDLFDRPQSERLQQFLQPMQ